MIGCEETPRTKKGIEYLKAWLRAYWFSLLMGGILLLAAVLWFVPFLLLFGETCCGYEASQRGFRVFVVLFSGLVALLLSYAANFFAEFVGVLQGQRVGRYSRKMATLISVAPFWVCCILVLIFSVFLS